MTGTWLLHPDLPSWDPMTLEEGEILLEEALKIENKTWIDARDQAAFENDHILDAILLNENDWDYLFGKFIKTWDGISVLIVYCDSRTCAASNGVAERLKQALGTEEVYVLKGGWETWLENQN